MRIVWDDVSLFQQFIADRYCHLIAPLTLEHFWQFTLYDQEQDSHVLHLVIRVIDPFKSKLHTSVLEVTVKFHLNFVITSPFMFFILSCKVLFPLSVQVDQNRAFVHVEPQID